MNESRRVSLWRGGGGKKSRTEAGITLLIAQSQLKAAVDRHTQLLQKLQGPSLLSHTQDASPNRTHIRCFDVCVLVIAVDRIYICGNVFMFV